MTLPLVTPAVSTRKPETPEDLRVFVVNEIAPVLQQLRRLFNGLMDELNGDPTVPVNGVLEIGGVTITVSATAPVNPATNGAVWVNTTGTSSTTLWMGVGGVWTAISAGGGGGGTPATTVVSETAFGQAAAVGASTNFAREDHTHGTPAAPAGVTPATTVVAETAYGQASTVGVATKYAREDHTHGTPAAVTVPSPAASVVAETAFGASSAVGVSSNYARQDHTHGTPATPVTQIVAGTNVTISPVGGTGAVTVNAAGGGGGTPATTVTAMNAFGLASVVGTSTNYAREDHRHSTPATTALVTSMGSGMSGFNALSIGGVTGAQTGAVPLIFSYGHLLSRLILTSGTSQSLDPDVRWIRVIMIGGGGGGGGAGVAGAATVGMGAGGASGGYAEKTFTVGGATPLTLTYAIGAGGTAGANTGGNGGNGGATTATYNAVTVTAQGGTGGAGRAASATTGWIAGGTCAVSTNGDINGGGDGGQEAMCFSTTIGRSGAGGNTHLGGGGSARITSGAGNNAIARGAGGGGALAIVSGAAALGGTGSGGIIILEQYS